MARYQVLVTLAAIAACAPQPAKENSWGLGATVFMGSTGADLIKTNTAIAAAECRMEPVEIDTEDMDHLIDAMEFHAEEGSDESLAALVEAATGVNDFFNNDDTRALVEEFSDVLCDSHYQLTQSIMATFVNAVLKDSTAEIYGPYSHLVVQVQLSICTVPITVVVCTFLIPGVHFLTFTWLVWTCTGICSDPFSRSFRSWYWEISMNRSMLTLQ